MIDESPNPDLIEGEQGAATQTEQSIMVIVEHRPEIVLLQPESREKLFEHIEAEIAAFEPDLSTDTSRKAIAAMAFKVTRTKTAIEAARLRLTEEAREKIKAVNAEGAPIKERLEALAKQVRAPLTAWEDAEEKREGECKAALERLRMAAIVPMNATADSLRTRITEVEAEPMAEDHWRGMLELAETAKAMALEALAQALALVEQKERDAAELAELRAAADQRREAEEKLRQRNEYIDSFIQHITEIGLGMIGGQPQPYGILISDLEDRIPPEIETFGDRAEEVERHRVATLERVKDAMLRQQERREAEERAAEEKRVEDEKARAAQSEQERAEADERARVASEQASTLAAARARAEEAARAEQQAAEQQRAHEEELQAANARAAEIERQAEQQRLAREAEDEKKRAEEQAAAAERAHREADQARRTAVKRAAKEAIMTVTGVTEAQAQAIVILIIAGEVPYCLLDFAAEPKVRPASSVPGVGQGAGGTPQDGKML